VVKRKIAALLLVLFLAGCSPAMPGAGTGSPDTYPSLSDNTVPEATATTPNESISTESSIPPSTAPSFPGDVIGGHDGDYLIYFSPADTSHKDTSTADQDTRSYSELKTDMENEIDKATRGVNNDYAWGLVRVFEEMLRHRESIEDVNEGFGRFYSGLYEDFGMYIAEVAVFSDGTTNYRVLLFGSWYIPLDYLYLQIYNDEYCEVQHISSYDREGGSYGEMLYCAFVSGSDRNNLVVIDKIYHEASNTIDYYVTGFQVSGIEIIYTTALKEEVTKEVWTVKGPGNHILENKSIHVFYSNAAFWPERYWISDYGSLESFENNTFTIQLNNTDKDKISILFKDGVWEVVQVKEKERTPVNTLYTAYMESTDWAWQTHPYETSRGPLNSDEVSRFKVTASKIYDFDDDGVLDLWFKAEDSADDYSQRSVMTFYCTIADGRVKQLLNGFSGRGRGGHHVTIMQHQELPMFVVAHIDTMGSRNLAGEIITISYYSIKNGELSTLETARYSDNWMLRSSGSESKYGVNGQPVSQEEYYKVVDKYIKPICHTYF
jgi:hypothetical protein